MRLELARACTGVAEFLKRVPRISVLFSGLAVTSCFVYMQEMAFSFSGDAGLLFVAENQNLKSRVVFFLTNHPVSSLSPFEVKIR